MSVTEACEGVVGKGQRKGEAERLVERLDGHVTGEAVAPRLVGLRGTVLNTHTNCTRAQYLERTVEYQS